MSFYTEIIKKSQARREKIRQEILGGAMVRDVAKKYGISRQRIHQMVGSANNLRKADELQKIEQTIFGNSSVS